MKAETRIIHRMAHTTIMYNNCYGGLGFSSEACAEYLRRTDITDFSFCNIERDDPVMVAIVREMGKRANGQCARIKLHELDDRYAKHYSIHEYDGLESVEVNYERHALDSIKATLGRLDLSNDAKVDECRRIVLELRGPLPNQK